MKKNSKLGKTLIITMIIAAFLTTCGVVVYAVSGFTADHSKPTNGNSKLTSWDWYGVLNKLDDLSSKSNGNGRIRSNPFNCTNNSNTCCEFNGELIQCTYNN